MPEYKSIGGNWIEVPIERPKEEIKKPEVVVGVDAPVKINEKESKPKVSKEDKKPKKKGRPKSSKK